MRMNSDRRASVALGGREPRPESQPLASHAALARSVTIRLMLNAALAKMKSASTFGRPRSFTFRNPAIVLSHPKAAQYGAACVDSSRSPRVAWSGRRSHSTLRCLIASA